MVAPRAAWSPCRGDEVSPHALAVSHIAALLLRAISGRSPGLVVGGRERLHGGDSESSSESIMLQIELGNEARCGGSCNRASTEWRQRFISRRRRKLDVADGTSSRCRWSSSAAPLSRRKLDQPKKEARGPAGQSPLGAIVFQCDKNGKTGGLPRGAATALGHTTHAWG